ncbi:MULTISPECIES: hypothetical protein [unclassified Mycolicibacterium]|uniref:hypothetical protein n=1 Tax=unclassified Mycolicibacterium TaxID=2636767 RepID=UPI0012DEB00F|nr:MULTISPECIES: hypothetical protein [unclassified Mycolicibacterium]MUL82272.1 hypothetical protein [Mycolicibacterium sp. CBMA 329]MUL88038.1 hypothetical protein [Mycolicibacterium sp. CBMA 331]MUM02369.1 hypothetical protein [Mycolicibacterium sp. CBMA 334]MUM29124.1 hypothetical protein [Mycolicibacterium sp. CBMA 295]MUM38335.1 hypothetical protein [Mycolicibacterium sp. CBMA 247]
MAIVGNPETEYAAEKQRQGLIVCMAANREQPDTATAGFNSLLGQPKTHTLYRLHRSALMLTEQFVVPIGVAYAA